MIIGRPETADIAAIAALEQSCFTDPWSEKSLLDAWKDANYILLVCKEEDVVLGYCGLLCMGPEADLVFICTAPKARRRGIAELLLKSLAEEGKKNGVSDVFLEVREGNAPARALYQKFGFEENGLRKNYYDKPKENAVLMHCSL